MCGLYNLTTTHQAIRQLFPENWQWNATETALSANLGPSSKKPDHPSNHRLVVRNEDEETVFDTMRWRFEMKWMRDKGVHIPINAKSETMFTNGMFKHSASSKRCLIITNGFYEPKGAKGTKREQYLFTFPNERPFALGGLWCNYKGDDDEFNGFVICTTTPNNQISPIHHRMPVILDDAARWGAWLNGSDDEVRMLCEPNETPELKPALVPPRKKQSSLF